MYTKISPFWIRLLPGMFPLIEEALGKATNSHMKVIAKPDLLRVEDWVEYSFWPAVGRPKFERSGFLIAFVTRGSLINKQ